MDKSRKSLKLDPDKEKECDPHHSAAAYGLRNRFTNDRCWRYLPLLVDACILRVDEVENWHLNKPLKGLGISKHFSARSACGPFQDQRYTPGLLNYALRHLSFQFCDSTAALICGLRLFWGRRLLKNSHRFIKKMVTFGGKMDLLTLAVPNYKTVLGRKISFSHCFRKSVMSGLRFLAFTGGA